MVKVLKNGQKKERSVEKRKRLENTMKARAHAKRYVIPFLVFLLAVLAAFLLIRYGLGTKPSPEELSKLRARREISKMMRANGGDLTKLREMMGKKDIKTNTASVPFTDSSFDKENIPKAEEDVFVE